MKGGPKRLQEIIGKIKKVLKIINDNIRVPSSSKNEGRFLLTGIIRVAERVKNWDSEAISGKTERKKMWKPLRG